MLVRSVQSVVVKSAMMNENANFRFWISLGATSLVLEQLFHRLAHPLTDEKVGLGV